MIPLLFITKDARLAKKYLREKNHLKDSYFYEVDRLSSQYSIQDVKRVIREVSVFEPKKRIYFFPDFHLSSFEAQNAFLKVLEEPPENILFVLTTINRGALLPTIVSRAKIINLANPSRDGKKLSITDTMEKFLSSPDLSLLSNKSFIGLDKPETSRILEQLILIFEPKLTTDKPAKKIITEILSSKMLLDNNNLNPQLTLDHILIFIYNCYNGLKDEKS